MVFRSPEGRWLSNGSACWPTDGVVIRAEDVRAIFAISRKQMEAVVIREGEVDEGRGSKIVVSCVYPVERECTVFTDSDKVRRQRGIILSLLHKRAPDSQLIAQMCAHYGAPPLERLKPVESRDAEMRFFLRPGSGGDWVAAFGGLLAEAIVAPEPVERAEEIMERVRELARMRVYEVQEGEDEKPGVGVAAG